MADDVAIAKRFHALSEEFANRPVVARRGTLPTLSRYLKSNSREVRYLAAQTLGLLAAHPENPELMCRESGLVDALFDVYKKSELEDPELHAAIGIIFSGLKVALKVSVADDQPAPNINDGESVRTVKNRPHRIRQSSLQHRAVQLQVSNLTSANDRAELEEVLQTTRGVVSYTINDHDRMVTLQLSASTATLLKLLSDAGFNCDVVSDVAITRTPGLAGTGATASYLPSTVLQDDGSDFRQSLVLHGVDHNTLATRLQRQREEQRKGSTERNAISSFIGKLTAGWW